MFEELTKKLDSFLDLGTPGYDCAVYHKGKCIYRHYEGYSDVENHTPMNGKEKYYIYSCSKVITCTAALQLLEKELYCNVNMSKYIALLIDTLNCDNSISELLNPIERIKTIVEKYNKKEM